MLFLFAYKIKKDDFSSLLIYRWNALFALECINTNPNVTVDEMVKER